MIRRKSRCVTAVGDAIGSQADLAPRQRNRGLGRFRRIFHSVQSPGRHIFLLMHVDKGGVFSADEEVFEETRL